MMLCSDILLAGGLGGASVQETSAPLLGPGEKFILNFARKFKHSTQSKTDDKLVFKSKVQENRASSVPLDLCADPLAGASHT